MDYHTEGKISQQTIYAEIPYDITYNAMRVLVTLAMNFGSIGGILTIRELHQRSVVIIVYEKRLKEA